MFTRHEQPLHVIVEPFHSCISGILQPPGKQYLRHWSSRTVWSIESELLESAGARVSPAIIS